MVKRYIDTPIFWTMSSRLCQLKIVAVDGYYRHSASRRCQLKIDAVDTYVGNSSQLCQLRIIVVARVGTPLVPLRWLDFPSCNPVLALRLVSLVWNWKRARRRPRAPHGSEGGKACDEGGVPPWLTATTVAALSLDAMLCLLLAMHAKKK